MTDHHLHQSRKNSKILTGFYYYSSAPFCYLYASLSRLYDVAHSSVWRSIFIRQGAASIQEENKRIISRFYHH